MFQTEQLQKVIDQLQHTDGLGYFDTLFLILKLIGLCAGPILLLLGVIVIAVFAPRWISYKLTPVLDGIKLYEYSFTYDKKKSNIEPLGCIISYEYRMLLEKRGLICYKLYWIILPIALLLLSPFIFNEYTEWIFWIFCFIPAVILAIIYVEIKGSRDSDWSILAKQNKIDKYEVTKPFCDNVIKAFTAMDSDKLKEINSKELEQYLNVEVDDRYCNVFITEK